MKQSRRQDKLVNKGNMSIYIWNDYIAAETDLTFTRTTTEKGKDMWRQQQQQEKPMTIYNLDIVLSITEVEKKLKAP